MQPASSQLAGSVHHLLAAREERVAHQTAALARFGRPLLSVTIVAPGPVKDSWLSRRLMEAALREVEWVINLNDWRLLWREVSWRTTGPEALYVVDSDARVLKLAAIALEDEHRLGRIWDLDVIATSGAGLSRTQLGRPARRCLACDRPAHECARSQRHPLAQLQRTIDGMVDDFDRNRRTSQCGRVTAGC